MQLAHAPSRSLPLDPKRIAATSAAIVVHVAVLMMLMMPAHVLPPKPIHDMPMVVVPIQREIPRLAPLPPERTPTPRATTQTVPTPAPVQAVVDDIQARPSDTVVERTTTEEVETSAFTEPSMPSFARIRADLAPAPPYPPQALRRGLTGLVMLRVLVDETGKPIDVTVETSSGERLLDDAAVKFVLKRWHFVAATQGGRAIRAYALVPISFELKR